MTPRGTNLKGPTGSAQTSVRTRAEIVPPSVQVITASNLRANTSLILSFSTAAEPRRSHFVETSRTRSFSPLLSSFELLRAPSTRTLTTGSSQIPSIEARGTRSVKSAVGIDEGGAGSEVEEKDGEALRDELLLLLLLLLAPIPASPPRRMRSGSRAEYAEGGKRMKASRERSSSPPSSFSLLPLSGTARVRVAEAAMAIGSSRCRGGGVFGCKEEEPPPGRAVEGGLGGLGAVVVEGGACLEAKTTSREGWGRRIAGADVAPESLPLPALARAGTSMRACISTRESVLALRLAREAAEVARRERGKELRTKNK